MPCEPRRVTIPAAPHNMSSMKHLPAADLNALAEKLQAMKRRALDEIRSTSKDIDTNVQPGDHEVQSNADAAEIQRLGDVRYAEIEIDRARLLEVEQAQGRIAEGRYGICEDCGNDIPVQRLLAQPAAVRCAACQAATERPHRR